MRMPMRIETSVPRRIESSMPEEEGTPRIAHGDLRDRRAGGPRAEALDPGRNLRPAM